MDMDSGSEETLVEGIRRKDEMSIRHFVLTYQDRVYVQVMRMLGNVRDTEETCQDVFLKAIDKIHKFRGDSKLSTWLYHIAYTTCLDKIRATKRRPYEEDIDDSKMPSWVQIEQGFDRLERSDQRKIIDRALAKLSEIDALIIDMFYLQELKIQEIAEITDMSSESIKVRLFRARKKLAVFLKGQL